MKKNLVKTIVGVLLGAMILGNSIYVAKQYINYKEFKGFIISMMRMGIGTKGKHTYESSIYGKEFNITYELGNDNYLKQKFEWQ